VHGLGVLVGILVVDGLVAGAGRRLVSGQCGRYLERRLVV
jgi:hypothetical protein